jgi:acyl-CoA thioester hydrolase
MFSSETKIRVHYALTDQMGFVYYGHYAQFYEIGRAEAIRQIGFSYKDIEAMGIIMPVGSMECKYIRPAKYDDLLSIKTILPEIPKSNRITFHHEIYNEKLELLNTGKVTLHFINHLDMKGVKMPEKLRAALAIYYTTEPTI